MLLIRLYGTLNTKYSLVLVVKGVGVKDTFFLRILFLDLRILVWISTSVEMSPKGIKQTSIIIITVFAQITTKR